MTRPRTTTFLNRIDRRQPSEQEIYAAAEALLDGFDNDAKAAAGWCADQTRLHNACGDRQAALISLRLGRALGVIWSERRGR